MFLHPAFLLRCPFHFSLQSTSCRRPIELDSARMKLKSVPFQYLPAFSREFHIRIRLDVHISFSISPHYIIDMPYGDCGLDASVPNTQQDSGNAEQLVVFRFFSECNLTDCLSEWLIREHPVRQPANHPQNKLPLGMTGRHRPSVACNAPSKRRCSRQHKSSHSWLPCCYSVRLDAYVSNNFFLLL